MKRVFFTALSFSGDSGELEDGIIIMGVAIVVNYFVSRNLFKVAKETQSQSLEADALHLQADIWTNKIRHAFYCETFCKSYSSMDLLVQCKH